MKLRLPILILLVAFSVLLVGCGKDATTPVAPAGTPDLPPADSWNFDLSYFDRQPPPMIQSDGHVADPLVKTNFLNALARVAIVKLVAVSALTPPYLAFSAAIHSTPVAEADSTYLWTYSWTDSTNHSVLIHLRGRVTPDHVDWSLRLTAPNANPPLYDFLWFTGESSRASFTGFWIFNEDVANLPVEAARIDWTYTGPSQRVLTFTNINPASADYGDSLAFTVAGDDMSLLFHDVSEGVDSHIAWNNRTGAGSIQVPDFNEGAEACWNDQHDDVNCEAP